MSRHRARTLLSVAAALLALVVAAAPASAALSGFAWPVQSIGNRGVDVYSIQSLLRGHGYPVAHSGLFTTETRNAVMTFQGTQNLPMTGVVETYTWARLVSIVGPGAPREPVLTLKRQLNQKRQAGLTVSETWDAATEQAVRDFERHVGLPVDGIADKNVWRWLVAHYDLPTFSAAALCGYVPGVANAQWGTGAAVGQVEAAGAKMVEAGYGRVAVGDISLEHRGDIPGHMTHEVGLDVDVRPMRDNRDQCRAGTTYRHASYDRTATRALIKAIRAVTPGHVKLIYFNDPVLIREGLTTWYAGHDDHLHIRYCELQHTRDEYRC